MTELHKLDSAHPSRVFSAGRGKAELFEIGLAHLCRVTYDSGWHWRDDWAEATGQGMWCQNRHCGIVLSGQLHIEMEDGSSIDFVAGDAYDIPPGHDGTVVSDEPWVAIDSEAYHLFDRISSE